MVSLDNNFAIRDDIALNYVKPILEDWNGGIELEYTAFYGIREYSTRNVVLRNHVDRIDTHVFSAILQVGQTGLYIRVYFVSMHVLCFKEVCVTYKREHIANKIKNMPQQK